MTPRVSILLPNRNHRPFLPERLQSILRQTFTDWELIVLDGQSDDGSWEYLQETLADDPRARLLQAPPRGIYPSWNQCLAMARGEFVCIAPADDTMEHGFLAAMVQALDENPECDAAHCKLALIDAQGRPPADMVPWDRYYGTLYFGPRIDQFHRRRPPHDGVLTSCVRTLYTSITQLLIRRRVFQRIGLFRTDLGTHADYEWGMRLGLTSTVVHVPLRLASWRVHDNQGTDLGEFNSPAFLRKLRRMIRLAWRSARRIDPTVGAIPLADLTRQTEKELFVREMEGYPAGGWGQRLLQVRWFLSRPEIVRAFRRSRSTPGVPFTGGMTPLTAAQELITRHRLEHHVELLPPPTQAPSAPAPAQTQGDPHDS